MTNNLFLIAYIAGRTVAIDSAEVDSVVDIGRITPVPYAYRDVAGLAALRSRVVTVIDPRGSLGLPIVERAKQRAIIMPFWSTALKTWRHFRACRLMAGCRSTRAGGAPVRH